MGIKIHNQMHLFFLCSFTAREGLLDVAKYAPDNSHCQSTQWHNQHLHKAQTSPILMRRNAGCLVWELPPPVVTALLKDCWHSLTCPHGKAIILEKNVFKITYFWSVQHYQCLLSVPSNLVMKTCYHASGGAQGPGANTVSPVVLIKPGWFQHIPEVWSVSRAEAEVLH